MADTVHSLSSDTTPAFDAPAPDAPEHHRAPTPVEPAVAEALPVEPTPVTATPGAPSPVASPVEPAIVEAPSTFGRAAWRCLDLVTAVVALIVLSPVMIVVAIMVKRSSPGPVIFRQTRVGRDGTEFELWKFRTMHDGTHQLVLSDPALRAEYEKNDFKLAEDDPHITPVGRTLRKSSLDELPQLLNVITGKMSLVGVRPLLPQELARRTPYDRDLYVRHRPGVTGLWQVEGRSNVKAAERIELDRRYLEHWSFWTNLKLALQTPRAVLFGHGAH